MDYLHEAWNQTWLLVLGWRGQRWTPFSTNYLPHTAQAPWSPSGTLATTVSGWWFENWLGPWPLTT